MAPHVSRSPERAVMYVPLTLLRTAKGGDVFSIAASDGRMLGDMALLYTVGPLAAFDAYLQSPSTLTETWSISYFFLHAANRLGFNITAPSTHLGYVVVGPQGTTNVYTMYLAYYPEFGIAGVIVLCAIVGYTLVWLYRQASARGGSMLLLYGLAFNEICKSGFNEGFFMGLNMWLKAVAYCLAPCLLGKALSGAQKRAPPRKATCSRRVRALIEFWS